MATDVRLARAYRGKPNDRVRAYFLWDVSLRDDGVGAYSWGSTGSDRAVSVLRLGIRRIRQDHFSRVKCLAISFPSSKEMRGGQNMQRLRDRAAASVGSDFAVERKRGERRPRHRHAKSTTWGDVVEGDVVRAATIRRHLPFFAFGYWAVYFGGSNARVATAPVIWIGPDPPHRSGRSCGRARSAYVHHAFSSSRAVRRNW